MMRSGRSYRKSVEMALDGAESSVADVLRMLVEDRRRGRTGRRVKEERGADG